MKTNFATWGILLGTVFLAPSFKTEKETPQQGNTPPSEFRVIKNEAFKEGEELRYRLHYGVIDAGEAILKVNASDKKVQGRKLLHVEGTGRTLGAFDWFFKVRDRYESYVDEQAMFPWLFIRRVNEGGYKINQDYTFLQNKNKIDLGEGKSMDAPAYVQDMISSFYYARTLNFENAKPGDIYTINAVCDGELFPMKIRFMGKETVSLRKGKYRCLRFVPIVLTGRIFKESEDLSVWITDDKNKIPILAKAKIMVGSIKAEVVEYKNLANPIAKVN